MFMTGVLCTVYGAQVYFSYSVFPDIKKKSMNCAFDVAKLGTDIIPP